MPTNKEAFLDSEVMDGDGNKVIVKSFFSKIYIDNELMRLNREYVVWKCDGSQVLSSLGQAEPEFLVARLLVLARVSVDNGGPCLVGVKKSEFENLAKSAGENYFIRPLLEHGFFREKEIEGEIIIFPTEKLLENQKISKIQPFSTSINPLERAR